MTRTELKPPFTNLQQALLPFFAQNLPDEDIRAIQQLVTEYLINKARIAAAELDTQRGVTDEDYLRWAREE